MSCVTEKATYNYCVFVFWSEMNLDTTKSKETTKTKTSGEDEGGGMAK